MDGTSDRPKTGLNDPRAVNILTTEHWSLLTSRTLGYQAVNLFIGFMTFARSVAINFEDARWSAGMDLLRQACLKIVPELETFFTRHSESLAHGAPQGRRRHPPSK